MTISYHSGNRIQGLSTDIAETLSFSDDYTTYADQASADAVWVPSVSTLRVNTTNDNVDFTNGSTSCYYDLGTSNVSDSSWILRCKVTLSTVGTGDGLLWVILSNNSSGNQYTAQTFAGTFLYDDGNNTYANSGINVSPASGTNYAATGISPSVTTYYIQITRTSTLLTVNYYSNSGFSTLLGTASVTITASVTGLRYIKFLTGNTGQMIGTIDDIQFWNGVSSVNSKPTNVPNGSRFEETDTRKIYYSSTVHTFLLADTGTSFTPSASGTVEYLVVAGGGGGAFGASGGGGAGGFRSNVVGSPSGGGASAETANFPVIAQAYTITVGAGGAGCTSACARGGSGGESTFSSITSLGGGGSGGQSSALTGGSGGGASTNGAIAAGAGTTGQGYGGGAYYYNAPNYPSGGGGGSGSVGVSATAGVNGNGGSGTASSISGSSVTYAGGGGAGMYASGTVGTGQAGGGSGFAGTGTSATANSGSGGGGGSYANSINNGGGSGGSGIVIIKYTSGVNATGGTKTTVWSERA